MSVSEEKKESKEAIDFKWYGLHNINIRNIQSYSTVICSCTSHVASVFIVLYVNRLPLTRDYALELDDHTLKSQLTSIHPLLPKEVHQAYTHTYRFYTVLSDHPTNWFVVCVCWLP